MLLFLITNTLKKAQMFYSNNIMLHLKKSLNSMGMLKNVFALDLKSMLDQ